jgi:hypothetical protein
MEEELEVDEVEEDLSDELGDSEDTNEEEW